MTAAGLTASVHRRRASRAVRARGEVREVFEPPACDHYRDVARLARPVEVLTHSVLGVRYLYPHLVAASKAGGTGDDLDGHRVFRRALRESPAVPLPMPYRAD